MWSYKATWLYGHVTLCVEAAQGKSPLCKVLSLEALWQWRYIAISLSRDLAGPCDFRGYLPLKVSHRPNTFGGYRRWGSGDTMVLVCHVISQ